MTQLSTAMAGRTMVDRVAVLRTARPGPSPSTTAMPPALPRDQTLTVTRPRPALLTRPLTPPFGRAWLDVVVCLLVALVVTSQGESPAVLGLVAVACWSVLLISTGHYRRRALGESRVTGAGRVLRASVTALLLAAASTPLLTGPAESAALLWLAVAFTTTTLLMLTFDLRRRTRLVLAGHPREVREALANLRAADREDVVAVCLTRRASAPFAGIPTYVGMAQACAAVTGEAAHALVVLPGRHASPVALRRLQWDAARVGAELYLGTGLLDVEPQRARVVSASGLDVLHVTPPALDGPRRLLKDVVERSLALGGYVLALPVLGLLCLMIRLETPGPALFRQERIGRDGVPFTMLKLRSMGVGAEAERSGLALDNEKDGVLFKIQLDPRVTPLGRRLRRYSLDELPQLWNVVRGDMSLVGPRPALPTEVAGYGIDPRRRLVVKPGVTGLWQVSGRSDLTWPESVRLDLRYVDNWSLRLDLKILARTIAAVVSHRGAY